MVPNDQSLKIISVFHYVLGGIAAFLLAAIPLLYIVLGFMMLTGNVPGPDQAMSEDPILAYAIITMGCIFLLIGQAIAWVVIISGRFIAKRKNRTFSIVIAALMCLAFPFGTVLGVFTLILLSHEEAAELYGAETEEEDPDDDDEADFTKI